MRILFLIFSLLIMMIEASDVDASPQGFMLRLNKDEARMTKRIVHKKDKFHSGSKAFGSIFMAQLIDQHETDFYFSYLQALAKAKIPNKLKIACEYVMIPFFVRLCEKPQEQQADIVDSFLQEKFALHYALWRLCLAALSHAVDLPAIRQGYYSDYMLCAAIDHEDTSLARLLLVKGANVNGISKGYSTLWWCKRKKEAQLLTIYKADVLAQHANNDLIEALCGISHTNKQEIKLMEFFLSSGHELRNEDNKFGSAWLEALTSSLHTHRYLYDGSISAQKIKLLLRFGHYEAKKNADSGEPVGIGNASIDWVISNYLTRAAPSRLVHRAITGKPYLGVSPVIMKNKVNNR